MGGVEPPTSSLPRTRSNQLSYMGNRKPLRLSSLERETGFEPATPSLEGLCSSQLSYSRPKPFCVRLRAMHSNHSAAWWRGEDSNLRRLMPTGLQPVPFDRFGTSPGESGLFESARERAQKKPRPAEHPRSLASPGNRLYSVLPVLLARQVVSSNCVPWTSGAARTELARGLEPPTC